MKCAQCKLDYPESILSPLQSSYGDIPPVCGICALEISNKIHGDNRKKFTGPKAEKMRLAAIEWRKSHS